MKVLHVIDSGGLYGAEVMLLHLAEEQIRLGHQPLIASISEPGISEKAINQAAKRRGIPLQLFEMNPGLNIKGARSLVRFAKETRVDLFHSHGYKGNILLGMLSKKKRAIPIITTLHGYTSTHFFSKMQIYEMLDCCIHNRLDAVVLVNQQMVNHPKIQRIRHKKLLVIDNGIPLIDSKGEEFTVEENKDYKQRHIDIVNFCKSGFVIGSVGRYSPEKGYDLLIKAVKKLRNRGFDVKLVLIGEGRKRRDLEELVVDLHLEKTVFLAGYYPQASKLMSYLDVYVISSYSEGLPITLLEAMRAKVPVVATTVGGIPEVLENGDCGILIPPDDQVALVDAIEVVIKKADIGEKMADLARKRFVSSYSLEKMTREYIRLYKEVSP